MMVNKKLIFSFLSILLLFFVVSQVVFTIAKTGNNRAYEDSVYKKAERGGVGKFANVGLPQGWSDDGGIDVKFDGDFHSLGTVEHEN